MNTCNSSTWEFESRGSRVQGCLCLHRQLETSMGYMRPCLWKAKIKYTYPSPVPFVLSSSHFCSGTNEMWPCKWSTEWKCLHIQTFRVLLGTTWIAASRHWGHHIINPPGSLRCDATDDHVSFWEHRQGWWCTSLESRPLLLAVRCWAPLRKWCRVR